jgi:hypothetical protein
LGDGGAVFVADADLDGGCLGFAGGFGHGFLLAVETVQWGRWILRLQKLSASCLPVDVFGGIRAGVKSADQLI